jgi:urease
MALHGSFLPIPAVTVFPELQEALVPGKILTVPGLLSFNVGRKTVAVSVTNLSDRPIQVHALVPILQLLNTLPY